MLKKLTVAAGLALAPALACSLVLAAPSPSTVSVDRALMAQQQPGTVCLNLNSTTCTPLGSIAPGGGFTPSGVATLALDPRSLNMTYNPPFTGAGPISQQQKNQQTVNIDEFAAANGGVAPGSGTSDDTGAANAALLAMEASNGVVQLSCGKTYYFAGVVNTIGATLRQCITAPNNIYDKTPIGFPGSTITGGHIILGPNAYFNMARGGGVRNAVVVASWVTSMINPDFSQFVGTAFLQGSGGLGDGVFMDDVIALGFAKCYDGTNGGFHVEMHHFVCDALNGEIIGPAADTDKLDDISNGPYLTASFPGYNVAGFSASNGVVTLSYTGPVMVVGGRVMVKNDATLGGNYTAFITAATGSSSPTSASTVSFTNPTTSDVTLGQVLDYNRALLRSGGGTEGIEFLPGVNSDDIRIGRFLDFGHDICADFQSNGNVSGDHFWCDNNNTYGVRNVGSTNVHITDLDASTDNVGIASFYRSGSRPSMRIEHANVTATFGDCTEPAGNFSIGYLECINIGTKGSGYAVDSSDGSALIQINSGIATSLASGLIASGGTLDDLDIHLIWTNPSNPSVGVFSGLNPTLPILPVSTQYNGTVYLSPNINISKINVSSNIGTIGNGYDGREYTLICTTSCVFYNKNGLQGAMIALKNGASTATGPGAFKFVYNSDTQLWYQQ